MTWIRFAGASRQGSLASEIFRRVWPGARIPVELLLRKLGEGATPEDLLDAYPRLAREDIRAAMAFAVETSLASCLERVKPPLAADIGDATHLKPIAVPEVLGRSWRRSEHHREAFLFLVRGARGCLAPTVFNL
jgi:Protein of unknown function (DUF433)